MTPSLIISVALAIGVLVLVGSVAYGVLGYNPDDAHAIRRAEDDRGPMVYEEVRRIHIRAPERFDHDRIDRHPAWLALMLAGHGYAISILAGAEVTNNVRALDPSARTIMAGCFLIGSFLCLVGAAMGVRFWRWRFKPAVHDNMTSAMLSDDIRLPYTLGGCGAAVMGVSTGIYSTTSFQTTLGSLGGWMTAWFALACTVMVREFYRRVRRYDRARNTIIDQAIARIEHDDG